MAAALLVLLVACGDDGDDVPIDAPMCPIGDRTLPIELAPITAGRSGDIVDLADGGTVELLRPDQGGKVTYVGVKAKNVDGCNVNLTAALRDPASNLIIALESRPVLLDPAADGWGVPRSAYYNLANVPACPSASAPTDVDQGTWRLEMRLEEPDGRSATTALDVSPRCLDPDELAECECECDADYVLGESCPVDP